MMKKVVVIGHMDWQGNNMIGAVVKARNIYEKLQDEFEKKNLGYVDIYNWKKKKIMILSSIVAAFAKYHNIVLVCSDTSRMLMRLFTILKHIFHNNIHYCVVGGDIAEKLEQSQEQIKALKCIDSFFVETRDCVDELNKIGINNVELLRNFKCIEPLEKEQIKPYKDTIFRFCTFSRVVEEKGIGDAMQAIEEINKNFEKKQCKLDIYGPIAEEYESEFRKLLKEYPSTKYCGVIDSKQSVEILQNYYCLLFPTRFQTEGIPGTIVDGFAAALPVICSDWARCRQIVTDGVDGLVYPFGSLSALKEKIKFAVEHEDIVFKLKFGALDSFELYKPNIAIQPLLRVLRN